MAVNKNFVVKNGLEVNTNLILADAATDKVGIGTTVPGYTLDVAGGIGATSVYAAGFSTFIGDVKIGSAQTTLTSIGNSVGVGTDAPAFLLDVRSAVSTGSTSLYVKGDARITGNLDVTGDISYDEVTGRNLYITGLSTFVGLSSFKSDVQVGAALSVVGVSTFHSAVKIDGNIDANGALDVDGQTDLDVLNVAEAATFSDDVTLTTANTKNILFDKSSNLLKFGDSVKATFGDTNDLQISHNGTDSIIKDAGVGRLKILGGFQVKNVGDTQTLITANTSGANATNVELYYSNVKRLETSGIGVTISNQLDTTNLKVSGVSTFTGAIDANANVDIAGNLDVDGHTELDNVNISGLTTAALLNVCLLYTSPSPRDRQKSRMPSSA